MILNNPNLFLTIPYEINKVQPKKLPLSYTGSRNYKCSNLQKSNLHSHFTEDNSFLTDPEKILFLSRVDALIRNK